MTIQIELDEPGLAVLEQEASRLGVTVEQLAGTVLRSHIGSLGGRHLDASNAAFRKAMTDTFRDNEEVYRRLAK